MKRSIKCMISLLLCFAMVAVFLPAIPNTAQAEGNTPVSTSNLLVDEDFESGLPANWGKYSEYGVANGSVVVNDGDGSITIESTTVHWGVGTEFSVADKGAHTQIRLTFNYSGAGSMVARTYNVATGTQIKQLFNTPATAEGKTETAVLDLPAGVENIRLTTLALKNAGSITIDSVTVGYVHTYNNQRLSDVQASAASGTKPASYYIKCDTCDVLAKDDVGYTGVKVKYGGVVAYEDFETATVGEKKLADGWTVVNGVGSYGIAENGDNSYFYIQNNHVNTPGGMKTNLSLADRNGHTKIALSMNVKGGGDFPGVLQSSFMVYNANGAWINNNTSAKSYAYNDNFNNVSWEDWTRITIVKDVVLPETVAGTGVDANGATATWQLVQRFGSTAALYIDDITVEYVHSYTLGRDSGVAAPEGTYIKCDYCDKLAKDDPTYSGITTKLPSYILIKEDLERATIGANKAPAGWTSKGLPGTFGIEENNENTYFYAYNNQATQNGAQITTQLNLGQSNGHTQIVLSMDVKGGGDFPGVLQSSFMVYNADGVHINNNTTSRSYSYNDNFNNVAWNDWTRISIVKDIVLPKTVAKVDDCTGATATWSLNQRWNATAPLYIDNIIVEYVHTYNQMRNSGIEAPNGGTYIKCDYCDMLKINDRGQNGVFIIPAAPAEPEDTTHEGHAEIGAWQTDGEAHWRACVSADCDLPIEEYKTYAVNHSYDFEVVSLEYWKSGGTCVDKGVYYKSCICGVKGTETFETINLGHLWSDWKVIEDATCEGNIVEERYCLAVGCGDCCDEGYETRELEGTALGHSFNVKASDKLALSATCVDSATYYVQCDVCDAISDTVTVAVGESNGHSFNEKASDKIATAADCLNAATYYVVCDNCDTVHETKTVVVGEANGHSFTDKASDKVATEADCLNAATYYVVCDNCDAIDETKTVAVGDALGHSWNDGEQTTAPTCEEKGVMTYTCSACGETKTEEIDAKGHTLTAVEAKEATVEAEGNIAYWTCECGKWFADAEGKTEITDKASVVIPKLDPPEVPETGDNTALALVLVVMMMSCVALVVTKTKFGYSN